MRVFCALFSVLFVVAALPLRGIASTDSIAQVRIAQEVAELKKELEQLKKENVISIEKNKDNELVLVLKDVRSQIILGMTLARTAPGAWKFASTLGADGSAMDVFVAGGIVSLTIAAVAIVCSSETCPEHEKIEQNPLLVLQRNPAVVRHLLSEHPKSEKALVDLITQLKVLHAPISGSTLPYAVADDTHKLFGDDLKSKTNRNLPTCIQNKAAF